MRVKKFPCSLASLHVIKPASVAVEDRVDRPVAKEIVGAIHSDSRQTAS